MGRTRGFLVTQIPCMGAALLHAFGEDAPEASDKFVPADGRALFPRSRGSGNPQREDTPRQSQLEDTRSRQKEAKVGKYDTR